MSLFRLEIQTDNAARFWNHPEHPTETVMEALTKTGSYVFAEEDSDRDDPYMIEIQEAIVTPASNAKPAEMLDGKPAIFLGARAIFHPQAWQNDYAIPVDPEGETSWPVARGEYSPGDDNDHLKDSLRAPQWVRDWTGPFEIEIVELTNVAGKEPPNDEAGRYAVPDVGAVISFRNNDVTIIEPTTLDLGA